MATTVLDEKLLTPREVAAILRVRPDTIKRWADSGRISYARTPSGRNLYRESEVRALLTGARRPRVA